MKLRLCGQTHTLIAQLKAGRKQNELNWKSIIRQIEIVFLSYRSSDKIEKWKAVLSTVPVVLLAWEQLH